MARIVVEGVRTTLGAKAVLQTIASCPGIPAGAVLDNFGENPEVNPGINLGVSVEKAQEFASYMNSLISPGCTYFRVVT